MAVANAQCISPLREYNVTTQLSHKSPFPNQMCLSFTSAKITREIISNSQHNVMAERTLTQEQKSASHWVCLRHTHNTSLHTQKTLVRTQFITRESILHSTQNTTKGAWRLIAPAPQHRAPLFPTLYIRKILC